MWFQLCEYNAAVGTILRIRKPVWDILAKAPRYATVTIAENIRFYIVDTYAIPDVFVKQTWDEQPVPDTSSLPVDPFNKY